MPISNSPNANACKVMKPQSDQDERAPLVCLIVYDQLCAFEYGIGLEVFGLPRPEFDRWYNLAIVAAEPGPLRAMGGISIEPDGGLDLLGQADIIVVPGWRGADAPVPAPMIQALRSAHENGARIASICTGAFVLAATGLLDGRRATTHWRYANALARKYPAVRVEPHVLYVAEGPIMTSAGSAAGLDLCLHIVRQDYGLTIANAVARRLVLPAHRDGAQVQVLDRPVVHERGGRIAPLLDRMLACPAEPWPVHRMADAAGLARRTFVRRFRDATGQTPLVWLSKMRVSYAKDLLDQTDVPLNVVMKSAGFGSAATFRREFRKTCGISPSEWRKTSK